MLDSVGLCFGLMFQCSRYVFLLTYLLNYFVRIDLTLVWLLESGVGVRLVGLVY